MSTATWPLVEDDNTVCMDCDRVLPLGTPFSKRLVAVSERVGAISELVCVYCATGPAQFCHDHTQDVIDNIIGESLP